MNSAFFRRSLKIAAACVLLVVLGVMFAQPRPSVAAAASTGPSFIEFESGHVRPIAMSPDGQTLLAVNTPNGTLEVIGLGATTSSALTRPASYQVPVGLEPVAVAARSNTEVWVVNHLSDSISIVSLKGTPHVVRTLVVGDEPRDIVFAGSPSRAFITTAHRGQQRSDPSISKVSGAGDPQMTTPSIPRADVWVFDPDNLDTTFGGTPLQILSFFTDTPRALAVSPDKSTVYVAGFKTGNQTTTVPQERICAGFNPTKSCTLPDGTISPGGNPGPAADASGQPAPEVGLIVKYNNTTGHWEDELKRSWDGSVRFHLPDTDVFAIDANRLTQTASFAHVGTTLFNMAVNPVNKNVYVSNTDSINNVRFEGQGTYAGHTVQGHLAESRITVLSGSNVLPRHLNKHIDYTALAGSAKFDTTAKDKSLSMPLDMAVTSDGATLYVAAFGSSKIGVFPTKALEDNSFDPNTTSANYIAVSGGGVSGLVLDEARGRMYATTRFDDAVKVIDLKTKQEISAYFMPNPEPASVVQGRPMLYDATKFSGNGEATCASCHIFGDMDDIAWDLGNPDATVTKSAIPIVFRNLIPFLSLAGVALPTPLNGSGAPEDFHPMKGPFTTQTLRGLANSGAMHWRGDRSVGPMGNDPTDATVSFNNFIVAFQALVGSATAPSTAEMQSFTNFQLQVLPPPNPVRNLDNALTASQLRGLAFYAGSRPSDGINSALIDQTIGKSSFNCNGCHTLDPSQGLFGTGRSQSFENVTQIVKVPHLRNAYAKIGMFGTPSVGFFGAPDSGNMGDQVRGFGYLGDGSDDTLFRFFSATVFNPTSNSGFPQTNPDGTRRDVEQFVLAFDSDLAPIVGQQVTLTSSNGSSAGPRIDLLIARASAPFTSKSLNATAAMECDLVATLVRNGKLESFLYDPGKRVFVPNDATASLSDGALRNFAATAGQEITYTAATPGSGLRVRSLVQLPQERVGRKR